ncbi:HET-domain-containing protein [Xylaria cf. heliscus]|nr:HET-domain-containing protein [Xylaria cf. heliscus]
MSSSPGNLGYYEPLPNATSIRVLVLAPGSPEDADIYCWILPSDLDWDHEHSPRTVPRPVESLSYVAATLSSGEERKFTIHVDMDVDSDAEVRMHPFQRYEALSYVWGEDDPTRDPPPPQQQRQHIFLDGGEYQVPVTRNLYAALRSLRRPRSGRRLWVDALCINQADHEEKKVQLGLMRRVYQQAEKVIAYLPLPLQDQKNINELVGKILRAGGLYNEREEKEEKKKDVGSAADPGQQQQQQPREKEKFNSVSEWEVVKIARKDENEPFSAAVSEGPLRERRGVYLEDFGLPREDSPLWDSWRRMFASPYFQRIWILQEIALGRNLRFWFGDGGGDAELLFVAHGSLDLYSGAVNMGYTASVSEEEDRGATRSAMVGSRNATRMFRERLAVRNKRPGSRLVDMLATVTAFQATDARDRIYALLGLTCDGAFFAQHVSYAPWDSVEKTFIKFARLFVEGNEGIEVLLQAGLRDDEDEDWPSWVPHWDNPSEISGQIEVAPSSGAPSPCMQADEGTRALHISGAVILDEIKVISEPAFEKLKVSSNGVSITPFLQSLTAGFWMIFDAASSSTDPEELFEPLFHILARPKPLARKNSTPHDPEAAVVASEGGGEDGSGPGAPSSSAATPSQNMTHGSDAEYEREYQTLRTGFHEFLNYLVALGKVKFSDPSDGMYQVLVANSPEEYYSFLRRAMNSAAHRRFCVTEGGHIGLVPKRTKTGDRLALFEGSDIYFVLRRINTHTPEKNAGGEGERNRYRHVGPAFFHIPNSDGRSSTATRQDITIV